MEKTETNEISVKQIIHKFYCDDCEKFILESTELSDGYYQTPQKYHIQHVELIGDYCKECAMKRIRDVVAYAESRGFDMRNT